jgi:hypothetical protein
MIAVRDTEGGEKGAGRIDPSFLLPIMLTGGIRPARGFSPAQRART